MMTVRQAAAELGVSGALIYQLCKAGRIRHERFGLGRGTIRIAPEALAEYRKAAAAGSAPAAAALKHIRSSPS